LDLERLRYGGGGEWRTIDEVLCDLNTLPYFCHGSEVSSRWQGCLHIWLLTQKCVQQYDVQKFLKAVRF
jgi:hypothetical protein